MIKLGTVQEGRRPGYLPHIFLRAGVIHGTYRPPELYSTATAERDLSKIRAVFRTKLVLQEYCSSDSLFTIRHDTEFAKIEQFVPDDFLISFGMELFLKALFDFPQRFGSFRDP